MRFFENFHTFVSIEVSPDPDKEGAGQLLLDPIDPNGMQYVFF